MPDKTWHERGIPNPGSEEALDQGCTCPVLGGHDVGEYKATAEMLVEWLDHLDDYDMIDAESCDVCKGISSWLEGKADE